MLISKLTADLQSDSFAFIAKQVLIALGSHDRPVWRLASIKNDLESPSAGSARTAAASSCVNSTSAKLIRYSLISLICIAKGTANEFPARPHLFLLLEPTNPWPSSRDVYSPRVGRLQASH